MVYNSRQREKTRVTGRTPYEGESLEVKINRMLEDNEPITEISETYYGSREDGVIPSTNIRSDRWDAAVDAMDAANRSKVAKREARGQKAAKAETIGEQAKEGMRNEGIEPTE